MNRAFYAMAIFSTKDGLPTNGIFGFIKLLLRIIDDEKPEYLAVAFDVHAPTFRHKMYRDYKGTRKPTPEELVRQMPVLKELLASMNIRTVELAGYEADDIIGTLSRAYDEVETVIFTGDRDAFQLVNEKTTVCFTKRGVSDVDRLTGKNFFEKVGLTPAQIIEEKALMGDSSDNIPGVKGIGAKTAASLLSSYQTVENIYRHIEDLKPSLGMRLELGWEMAKLSHKLATINVAIPISVDLESCRLRLPFSEEARSFFARLEFRSLVDSDYFPKEREMRVETVTCRNFDDFYRIFEGETQFSFDFLNDCHIFCGGKEFIFPLKETLLGDGFFLPELKPLFEKIFSSEKLALVTDVKQLRHKLDEMGISLTCPVEDVGILRYLCDSSARTVDAAELARGYAIPEENRAFALKRAFDEGMETSGREELKLYREMEMPLVDVLYEMEKEGVCVDEERFALLSEEYQAEMQALAEKIYTLAGGTFNLNSPFQLSEILFQRLGIPAKGFKKNSRGGYSTSAEVLEKLAEEHEIARVILQYREVQKLYSTYVEGMGALVRKGKIHTTYNQTFTTTGRLSSANPNLQNIPVRKERGRELRKLFLPSEGNVLIDADYSQIELRLLAHCSGCQPLIDAYNEGRDIHALTASQVFGVPLDEVSFDLRRRAKAVNFGIIYGISPHGLAKDLNTTFREAEEYIERYFKTYSDVKEYMENNVKKVHRDGYVTTIFGRKRYIPEAQATSHVTRGFGERAAMNMPLQGSAADIIKLAMVNVAKRLKKEGLRARMIMQVHDELLLDCPVEELEAASRLLKEEMEGVVSLRVPLVADVATGENWYDAK